MSMTSETRYGRSFYRNRISYPSPVRVERRAFDTTPVAFVPPSSRYESPRSPRFVPRRSLGDVQVTSATNSFEDDGDMDLSPSERPGLFSLARTRSSPRPMSPIPFSTPLIRQRHSPRMLRRPLNDSADSAYNSLSGDLNTLGASSSERSAESTLQRSKALLAQYLGLRDASASRPADPRTTAPTPDRTPRDGILVEHQYKIRQLELRLGDLESELRRDDGGVARRRRLLGSSASLGGGSLQDEPFRTNPLFHGVEDDSSVHEEASATKAALAAEKEKSTRLTAESEEQRNQLDGLKQRVAELESACATWEATTEELRCELEAEKATVEGLRKELARERAAACVLDLTPEPAWPPHVALESLEARLEEREATIRRLEGRLGSRGGPSEDGATAVQLRESRSALAAVGEVVRCVAGRAEPGLDALFGEPKETPKAARDVGGEAAALRAEVEALAEWLRGAYADAVVADAADSCNVS